ncbi:MAG: MBL fold metallo-hydrolase [Paludibacteraceae bacterium]|nr:MBL fold metallo-hydrolase [Paludibacteraceae bacterium]MBQ6764198.1 MBL fold metallo-hydrolase [Paludibacteraceae bacterium]
MDENGLIFRCFASGSSGNCYYLGTHRRGILIDAGISARSIQKYLHEMGLEFRNIMGVLITHDHADHIRAVGTLGERVKLPIYSTPEIHAGIDRNYGVREKLRTSRRFFNKGEQWDLYGLKINTFGIEHDSTDCVGYSIDYRGQRFVLMTDCGSVNEEMKEYIRTANHLVIEANHDEHMLLNGPYPTYLKERILSPRGHQSNDTCGELLKQNWHPGLRNVWLCHLSQENNDPEVAYNTVASYLEQIEIEPGSDIFLKALDRTTPSPVYELDDHMIVETLNG